MPSPLESSVATTTEKKEINNEARLTEINIALLSIKNEVIKLQELLIQEGYNATENVKTELGLLKIKGERLLKEQAEILRIQKDEKKKETTDLEQDLTDLTQVEPFTLKNHPINPKQVFEAKEPTDTKAGIWNNDSDFKNWIQPSIQDTTLTSEPVSITSFTLDRNMTGEELKQKLGKAKPFTIDQIATLIDNQNEIDVNMPKIKSPLDTSGKANLFLLEQVDGSVVVVYAAWHSGHRWWRVAARGLSRGWRAVNRVFSRND